MSPAGVAWVDGRVTDLASAVIPVTDRGFLYGDSVYEVLRTLEGRPVQLTRHLERLDRSAAAIGLPHVGRDETRRALREAVEAAEWAEVSVRLVVTRGDGFGLSRTAGRPVRTVVIVTPLEFPPRRWYEEGIRVAVARARRDDPGAPPPGMKTGNYRQHADALARARHAGFDDALFLNSSGEVTEGTTSNVFWATDGVLHTPSLECGLLAGTTRELLIDVCRGAGLTVVEGHYHLDDLHAADEAWLTGSIKGVVPIVDLGGRAIGSGRPGPLGERLTELHRQGLSGLTEEW